MRLCLRLLFLHTVSHLVIVPPGDWENALDEHSRSCFERKHPRRRAVAERRSRAAAASQCAATASLVYKRSRVPASQNTQPSSSVFSQLTYYPYFESDGSPQSSKDSLRRRVGALQHLRLRWRRDCQGEFLPFSFVLLLLSLPRTVRVIIWFFKITFYSLRQSQWANSTYWPLDILRMLKHTTIIQFWMRRIESVREQVLRLASIAWVGHDHHGIETLPNDGSNAHFLISCSNLLSFLHLSKCSKPLYDGQLISL